MTLVSILGDFHSSILPITYEFKEEIDRHIIVYDDASEEIEEINRLISGQRAYLDLFDTDSPVQYEIRTIKLDEDKFESIVNAFERIIELEENPNDIYLNTTDGLSSIAVVLSEKLLAAGGNIISYDRYANTYNLHDKSSMKKCQLRHNMDIESHLILKGYSILERTSKKKLAKRKDVIMKLTKNLQGFKRFANELQHKKVNEIYGNDQYKHLLKSINKLNAKNFIQGAVFEEYIYHLLVDNFDFDDVWQGTRVMIGEFIENEFDLLMIKDNHLHTIECKFKKDLDGHYFVFKTMFITNYLDDDGKSMILSIGGDNKNQNPKENGEVKFSKADKARAKYSRIKIHQKKDFSEKKFLKDIRNWFLAK